MFKRRTLLLNSVAGMLATSGISGAYAQAYPSRVVNLNVGFAPGGSTDVVARILAQKLSTKLGQPFVVQSKPGAAGMLAAEMVAKAPSEGYQLLVLATGTMTNAALMAKPPITIDKDLTNISFAAVVPLVLVVTPSVQAKTVEELVDLAKASPGKLTFGSDGIGAASHLAGEMFNKLTKVNTLHVPYKGGGESVMATVGGQVDMNLPTVTSALAMIQSGRLRPLAVSGSTRSPALPNVPTFEELGIKGFDLISFVSLAGPANMPKPVVDKLNAAMVDFANDPEVKAALGKQGMEAQSTTPDQSTEYFRKMKETISRLGRESNIKLE